MLNAEINFETSLQHSAFRLQHFFTLTRTLLRQRQRADSFAGRREDRVVTRNPMNAVYICDAVRTPFGRYGGALASVRTDDLAAIPIAELHKRNPGLDVGRIDDV